MVEVANKTVRRGRAESERVTPEVPLEDDNAEGHHDHPNEGESRLSAGKTGVEKGDTGNHNQDHGRRDQDVGLITGLVPLVQVLVDCSC